MSPGLAEGALDVHWVAAYPEEAPNLADDHERLITLGELADGDGSGSMLLAANNVGHVMLREGELTHRLLARTSSGTRMHEATMATGNDVLAALNGRTAHA